jgi:hypothetical protein
VRSAVFGWRGEGDLGWNDLISQFRYLASRNQEMGRLEPDLGVVSP